MNISRDKWPWFVIVALTCVCMIMGGIYAGLLPSPFEGTLGNFKAPSYVPDGYAKGETNTTNVDKTIMYINNNTGTFFIVSAIKDTQKSSLKEALGSLTQEEGMPVTNDPISVDGHDATFQVQKLNFMGVEINTFHVKWYCSQTGLTCVSMGLIRPNEANEMKKMVQSVKCHPKSLWGG